VESLCDLSFSRLSAIIKIKGLLVGNSYEQNIILSKEAREELN
jgi:hypothetical protein